MPFTVQPVTTEGQKIKLLVYGSPGVGKTSLAATANPHPDLGPVLYLDLEGGLLSVAGKDVAAVPIRNTGELEEVFFALHKGDASVAQYKTVVIDSGTALSNRALAEWTQRNMGRAARKGRGDADRLVDDVQLEDYGKMTMQMRRLLGWFRDLDRHLIVTALPRFVYPKDADTRTADPIDVGPSFTAQLQGNVVGMMDFVWYQYKDPQERRYLLTRQKGAYQAKTRGQRFAAALGEIVADPDLGHIYDLLIRTEGAGAPTIAQDVQEGPSAAQTP